MKSKDTTDFAKNSESKEQTELPEESKSKKQWQPMKLHYTGEAKDLIQHGVGKNSTSPGDPGEALKVPGH